MATFMAIMIPRAAVCAERIVEVLDTGARGRAARARGQARVAHAATVELRGVEYQLPGRGRAGARGHLVRGAARRGHRDHRLDRRRQDHAARAHPAARRRDGRRGAGRRRRRPRARARGAVVADRHGAAARRTCSPARSRATCGSATRTRPTTSCGPRSRSRRRKDFVEAMPQKLDAPIAQGGTNVSGGQRQRLAIARALLRAPGVYLFDDSFSALDLATEARLRARSRPRIRDADGDHRRAAGRQHPRRRPDPRARRRQAGRPRHARRAGRRAARPTPRSSTSQTERSGRDDGDARPRAGRRRRHVGPASPDHARPAGARRWRRPQKAKNFKASARRLLGRLAPERRLVVLVIAFALRRQRSLTVSGPEDPRPRHRHHLRGRPRRTIRRREADRARGGAMRRRRPVAGHRLRRARRRARAGHGALRWRVAVPVAAGLHRSTTSSSARCDRLRTDVEDKLMRVPLAYFDRQPHGEVLSPGHQRHRQRRDGPAADAEPDPDRRCSRWSACSSCCVVISPLLAVIALVTVPLSIVVTARIGKRAQKGFVAQWKHVGALNGQIEEAFTGHALVKVFGRRAAIEARFDAKNNELFDAGFQRAVRVEHHHAGDHVHREPQLRRDRGGRRAARRVGRDAARQRAGVHPVLAAVHPAAHPARVDGERAAVRRRVGRARVRAARRAASRPPTPRRGRAARAAARRGPVRGRRVPLQARRAADRRPVAGRRSPARPSPSSARPARARPRS